MKFINRILISAAALLGVVGCFQEEEYISSAILADVNSLTFEAIDATPQAFNIISQGVWTVEAPEWVTTDVKTGWAGQSSITVSVADNVIGEQMQLPRTDTLKIKGTDMYAHYYVIIKQLGDTYLGATEGTVSNAVALEAGRGFGLQESQVVAIATTGFVVTDGTSNIYIDATASVKVGDKVTLKGLRSTYNGMPSLTECENLTITSSATAQHTTQKDLSTGIAAYKATSIEYVAVKGATLIATQVIATDGGILSFHNAPESFNVTSLNAHYVDLYGYYISKDASGNGPFVVLTSIEDKGVNENVKLPVKWAASANDYPKWSSKTVGYIEPVEGFGQISYTFNQEKRAADGIPDAAASKTDVSGSNPRVNGAWPGDYWEFMSYVPAKAGQIIKLEFEGRISAGGMRYWRMQYKDGNEWKDCRAVKTVKVGDKQVEVNYTDDLYEGGSADTFNKVIVHAVKYANDTDVIAFRWTCAANYTGKDAVLGAPDSGSMRLDCGDVNNVQPSISIGTEADIPNDNVANVEVTVDKSLTFEALPAAAKSFKVLSDNEVELTADAEWIKFVGAEEALVETLTIPANTETEVFVTCTENVAAETREGNIEIKSGATTEKIKVTQVSPGVKLEPFVSIVGGNSTSVSFDAGTINLGVQTNVEFQYSSDAAWVTVSEAPATRALVDIKQLVVNYEANTEPVERTARIRVYNTDNNIETVYTLVQAAYESGVYFQDDFSWFSSIAKAEGAGDPVGTDNPNGSSPNVWKMAADPNSSANFFEQFNRMGYKYLYGTTGYTEFKAGPEMAPNASVGKDGSLYICDSYLKFGQTSYNAALSLPALSAINGTETVVVEFDWCWHVTGAYKPDLMTLSLDATVGQFPLTGTSTSEEVESTQSTVDGESHIVWQHASVVLTGATAETIITIRPTNADPAIQNSARKQNRWYLDNIKVSKYEGPLPTPSTKPGVIASFPFAYDTTFDASTSTVEGMWDLAQGWILSEGGTSKLSSHLADGSALKVTYKYEAAASDGTKDHVRVLATGMPKDGYWLFEVPVKDAPAGTYNITYKHSASATGPNYFLVEVSVDGQNWQPAGAQTTSETFKDGTSPRDVTWTYALNRGGVNAANVAHVVDLDFAAPALPGINTIYIRAKIADDMAYGSTKAMGGSGTNRIWGPCQVTLR